MRSTLHIRYLMQLQLDVIFKFLIASAGVSTSFIGSLWYYLAIMAVLSSYMLITGLSLFHLTMAFYLLTSPRILVDQNLVFILGEAMDLPQPPSSFMKTNPISAFASLLLIFLGVSDLVAVSQPEEVARWHWSTQAPIRLLFFFIVAGYSYLSRPDSMAGPRKTEGLAHLLSNAFVFTWAFLEMVTWFWIFVTIRDERGKSATKAAEKAEAEGELD